MSDSGDKQDLPRKTISEFISDAQARTRLRIQELGLDESALIDPEAPIDEQIVLLRALFLEAERSGLAFFDHPQQYWMLLKARLQPMVLAYMAYANTPDLDSIVSQEDPMVAFYRKRLLHSDQFRALFLNLHQQFQSQETASSGSAPKAKVATDDFQVNIIKSLEKRLQELEKHFNQVEKDLQASREENDHLRRVLKDLKDKGSGR